MNWEAIGAIAELHGARAVLATLLYLAVQVKHSRSLLEENRKISLSQVYQARSHTIIENTRSFQDPIIAALAVKIRGGYSRSDDLVSVLKRLNELTDEEKVMVSANSQTLVYNLVNSLYQFSLGLLNDLSAQAAHDTIRRSYPFWSHYDLLLTPRIIEWYLKHGDPNGDT